MATLNTLLDLRHTSLKPSTCVIFVVRSILTDTNLDVYRGPPVP